MRMDGQVKTQESTAQYISFEWSHFSILSIDSREEGEGVGRGERRDLAGMIVIPVFF